MLCVSLTSLSLVVSFVLELGSAGMASYDLHIGCASLFLWLTSIRTLGHTHSAPGAVGLQPEKPLEESEGSCC